MMLKLLPFLLCFLVLNQNLFAGAWTQKKGGGYYKLDFRFLSAKKIYDSDGEKIPLNGTFKDYTIGFYGEYGLSSNITISGSFLGLRMLDYQPNTGKTQIDDSETGIGDASLGLKVLLKRIGQTVLSGSVNLGIPTGKGTPDGELITSDGEFNQAITLQAGHSLYPTPSYLNLFVSFNNRNSGFSDEFRYGIEGGYSFDKNISVILKFKGLQPLKNGDPNKIGGFGVLLNNQRYIAYGAEIIYKLTKNIGISAFYESGTAGRNIVSTPVYTFGVFFAN